jgi:hypothetical protein
MQVSFLVLLPIKLTMLLQKSMDILVYVIDLHLHMYCCLHQMERNKEVLLLHMLHASPNNIIRIRILQVRFICLTLSCSLHCTIFLKFLKMLQQYLLRPHPNTCATNIMFAKCTNI